MDMTISRALVELKLLDKRITTETGSASFVTFAKGTSSKTVVQDTKEEFKKNANASYKSITDLIERRKLIKQGIVRSNSRTQVTVGDSKYFVSEAIERKNSITYEKQLLAKMKAEYSANIQRVEQGNLNSDNQLQTLLVGLQKEGQDAQTNIEAITETHQKINGLELFDPLKLKSKFEKLEKTIDQFEADVDIALSESNAITLIEV